MKNAELKIVHFGKNDVITTSAKWSVNSFKATNAKEIDLANTSPNDYSTGVTINLDGNEYINVLDGVGSNLSYGTIFTAGSYYHYDENSLIDTNGCHSYSNWKTCTEESHHAQ